MRSRYRPPIKRRYFHTKPRIDKRDMTVLKRKIEVIKQKKDKKELEEHFL